MTRFTEWELDEIVAALSLARTSCWNDEHEALVRGLERKVRAMIKSQDYIELDNDEVYDEYMKSFLLGSYE